MENGDISSHYLRANLYNSINIAFLDCAIDRGVQHRGTFLLLHGFPETSYQWRSIIPTLTRKGYRVIAPDYRGAGESSKPHGGFTKASMAADIIMLLDHKEVSERVHVVGHDMGGLIAFTLASRWPDRVASLVISECLLPGTDAFVEEPRKNPNLYFHYAFHGIENLPEVLISGREKTYIDFFINHSCYRLGAFPMRVIERYANAYSQPGALRCALNLFRAFDKDAEDMTRWVADNGKCSMRTLVLNGEHSSHGEFAMGMMLEAVQDDKLELAEIEEAGHFIAEENPGAMADIILAWADDK